MSLPKSAGETLSADEVNELGPLGAWASKSNNTSYLAETDGFVIAYANDKSGGGPVIYTDGSDPPTTARTKSHTPANVDGGGMTCPVRRGDYWKTVNCSVVFWLPIGS